MRTAIRLLAECKESEMVDFIHFSNFKDKLMLDPEYAVVENTTAYCMGDHPHYSSNMYPKMSERPQEDRVIIASLENHCMLSQHLDLERNLLLVRQRKPGMLSRGFIRKISLLHPRTRTSSSTSQLAPFLE